MCVAGKVIDKQHTVRLRNVGNVWRLAAIRSRQEDYYSAARATSYTEHDILVEVTPGSLMGTQQQPEEKQPH